MNLETGAFYIPQNTAKATFIFAVLTLTHISDLMIVSRIEYPQARIIIWNMKIAQQW